MVAVSLPSFRFVEAVAIRISIRIMINMTKKLTITVSDEVYDGLHRKIGARKISRFIDDLARKQVVDRPELFRGSLADGYREMAADEDRERTALEWIEANLDDGLPDKNEPDAPR
jgi:hypothetical protein